MRLLTCVLVGLTLACSAFALNPVASELRKVRPAHDEKKTITVPEGMVWYDGPSPTRGLRFPEGTYLLEAEDDEYWYFRAPSPLDFRVFSGREVKDEKLIPGGIMLGKRLLKLVPAGGYIEGESSTEKMMVWKLGRDFLLREGKSWTKSFDR